MVMMKLQMTQVQAMNNKVAIFSDLHLGVHQNSSFWIDVALNWVKWFKQDLHNKGIKDIIFCGDFFHYRDEISLISLDAGDKFLAELKDFDIHVITGNHDCYYKDTSEVNSLSILKGRKNITVHDSMETLIVNGKHLTFCPWGTKLTDIPQSDIIFGHFELTNFKMNAFKICDHGDDPSNLIDKAPLVFSGHFHLRDEKDFNKSIIVYVGNPFEMDFGDSGQTKGYYTLDISKGDYEFTECNFTPKHKQITLSQLINVKDIDKEFNETLTNNIVKVVIDKNISTEHLDALVSKMNVFKPNDLRIDYDVNYNKIKVDDKVELDLSGVIIEKAIDEFVNMLDIQNKSEVIEYTINLYNRSKL